tara:strand:+ start:224 stop:592 length:369 start_codon:yes stop_codon:yes gene_type:complete
MLKIVKLIIITQFLTACATGTQKIAIGLEEPTQLLLQSEALVGMSVSINNQLPFIILKNELTRNKLGIWGDHEKEDNEKYELFILNVNPGNNRLSVTSEGQKIYDKELYFSKGQKRIVRVEK